MLVQKYGGSSLGNPEKIKAVAQRIAKQHADGTPVVVVVSAMGDTTDDLIELADKVSPHVSSRHPRELDMLLTAGERISMALVSMALRDLGVEALSFTGSQAGIITTESHTRARILEIKPVRVEEELKRGKVVIIAGFQGVSKTKEITTLGRGGSDTTAVALAAALNADRCEIYTDVPGIFSADPRLVPNAVRYERLPLDLVFEMSVKGAQVMHPRSIEIAREREFPLYVGRTHPITEEAGTMLVPKMQVSELPKIVAVTAKGPLKKAFFPGEKTQSVLAELSEQAILVHGFELGPKGAALWLDPKESRGFLEKHAAHVEKEDLAMVSLVGYQLQHSGQTASGAIEALRADGVEPLGLTAQPQSITVWVANDFSSKAVAALHRKFIG